MGINQSVSTGVDIVDIEDFERLVKVGGDVFLSKIFDDDEICENKRVESLAGVFALKEAVIKAVSLEGGAWRKIKVRKDIVGKPKVSIDGKNFNSDGSISHTKNLAVAVFVVINA